MASVVFKKSEDDCPKSHQLLSVLLSYSADFEKNTLKCAGIIHFGILRIAFNNRDDLGLKQRKVGINTDFRAIGPAADTQFFDQTSKHVFAMPDFLRWSPTSKKEKWLKAIDWLI